MINFYTHESLCSLLSALISVITFMISSLNLTGSDVLFSYSYEQVIDHLRSLGIKKAACLGFCWGGWMGAHSLTEEAWSDLLVCAASPHPSMHIEGKILCDVM